MEDYWKEEDKVDVEKPSIGRKNHDKSRSYNFLMNSKEYKSKNIYRLKYDLTKKEIKLRYQIPLEL